MTREDRHSRFGSALECLLEEDRLLICRLGDWVDFRDLVKVRFQIRIHNLLLCHTWALHGLAQVGKPAEELLVVVGVPVGTLSDAAKAPSVGLPDKAAELGVFKEL